MTVLAALLVLVLVACLRALVEGVTLKIVSASPSLGADAVTGPTLPDGVSGETRAVKPRAGSGHQERKEGER